MKEHNTAFTAGSVVAQVVVAVVIIVGTAGAGAVLVAAKYLATAGIKAAGRAALREARQLVATGARSLLGRADDDAAAATMSRTTAQTTSRATSRETSEAMTCSVNSFTAGTLVLMADGTQRPIEDVEVGDAVLATDPQTGESGAREVQELIRHGGDHTMVDVTLDDGTVIEATDEHPFCSATRATFVFAIHLEAGEQVLGADGGLLTVAATAVYFEDLTAYNLAIEGIHTYYAGETPVLVHNTCSSLDDALATTHGQQRLADRGFDSIDVALARSSNLAYEQADGAIAHVAALGNSYNVIVVGQRGIVTAMKGLP